MREYSIFEAIYLSFFSRALYRDVANNWGGKAILYLLFIVALSWIVFTFKVQQGISYIYHANSQRLVAQIPELTIKNGIITTPENRPYFVYAPQDKALLAVIDTSGRFTSLQNAKAMVLVTPTSIYSQNDPNNPTDIRERQLPGTLSMVVNPISIHNRIINFIPFAWLFIFTGCVIVGFLYRFIQAFLYAIIGRMLCGIFNFNLTYSQVLQIAMVAMTPVLLVSVIIDAFNVHLPRESFFFFLLAMVYLIFGMFANSGE